jgi:hypothetical protein
MIETGRQNVTSPSLRGLLLPAVLALALAAPAAAASSPANMGCGSGALVLNISFHVVNDVDTGVKGNNWAFATYHRTLHVWRKAPGRYCAASTYDGVFTSIAGWSPAGKTQLPAGVQGTLAGSSVATFRGRFAPRGAGVRGFLGVKNFACTSDDRKGGCSGTFNWLRVYFKSVAGFRYTRYALTYRATQNGRGTWSDTIVADKVRVSGDIEPL